MQPLLVDGVYVCRGVVYSCDLPGWQSNCFVSDVARLFAASHSTAITSCNQSNHASAAWGVAPTSQHHAALHRHDSHIVGALAESAAACSSASCPLLKLQHAAGASCSGCTKHNSRRYAVTTNESRHRRCQRMLKHMHCPTNALCMAASRGGGCRVTVPQQPTQEERQLHQCRMSVRSR